MPIPPPYGCGATIAPALAGRYTAVMVIKFNMPILFDKDDKRVPLVLDESEWRMYSACHIMKAALAAVDAGEVSRDDCERIILATARVAHARTDGRQESPEDGQMIQSFINREEGRTYVLAPPKAGVTVAPDAGRAADQIADQAVARAAALRDHAKALAAEADDVLTLLSGRRQGGRKEPNG